MLVAGPATNLVPAALLGGGVNVKTLRRGVQKTLAHEPVANLGRPAGASRVRSCPLVQHRCGHRSGRRDSGVVERARTRICRSTVGRTVTRPPLPQREQAQRASHRHGASAPARASDGVGKSEGQSPSDKLGCGGSQPAEFGVRLGGRVGRRIPSNLKRSTQSAKFCRLWPS